jgi:hypothetical protein
VASPAITQLAIQNRCQSEAVNDATRSMASLLCL